VLNQADDLHRTLRSIDRESASVDCFVVDDGSQPPIAIEVDAYRFPIRGVRPPRNSACTRARNVGLEQIVDGGYDYVRLQDAGDVDVGERLALEAAYLDTHPDAAVVGAWAQYVDRSGRPLFVHRAPPDSEAIRARMPYVSAFAHPATMIRVAALDRIGRYD